MKLINQDKSNGDIPIMKQTTELWEADKADMLLHYNKSTSYPFKQLNFFLLETVYPNNGCPELIVTVPQIDNYVNTVYSCDNPLSPVHRNALHRHEFYELVYVIRGMMYQKIENMRHLYPAGSLCLLNRNVHHSEEFSTYFQAAFLALSEDFLDDMIRMDQAFVYRNDCFLQDSIISAFVRNDRAADTSVPLEYIDFIPVSGSPDPRMYRYFEEILRLSMNQEIGSTFFVKGILMKIFYDLIDQSLYETVPVKLGNEMDAEIFGQITDLMTRSNGRISRSELAEKMSYSGNYLNGIVKKYTGMSLFQYGTSICIKEACRLLRESNLSVSKISEHLNFSNRAHFYRLFEDLCGTTPAKYRKEIKKRKTESLRTFRNKKQPEKH